MTVTSEAARGPHADPQRALLVWALIRVPLVLLALFLLRAQIVSVFELLLSNIAQITEFVIFRASTPLSRGLLLLGAAIVYFAIGKLGERVGGWRGWALAIVLAFVVTFFAPAPIGWHDRGTVLIALLLAANWAPLSVLAKVGLNEKWLKRAIVIPPGLSEVLLSSRYFGWLRSLFARAPHTLREQPAKLPGAIIGAIALTIIVPPSFMEFERALRADPDVHMFAEGNYNSLAYDSANDRLYATGHGQHFVLSYDAANVDAAPLQAEAPSFGEQSLEFVPSRNEIYMFLMHQNVVQVLNTPALTVQRTITVPQVSPGDSWIAYEPVSDTLTIASEADFPGGHPFVVVDRETGNVRDLRDDDPGNLVVNPNAPIIYMSFFRRVSEVMAYNPQTNEIVGSAPADERIDRLAFDPIRNEVLLASPVNSRVQRFDADTLAAKGHYGAVFGVRVITIDATRNVMFVGSLASGEMGMVDMASGRMLKTWYVGPWLRSIVVAPQRGVAYVSSRFGLYTVNYADYAPSAPAQN